MWGKKLMIAAVVVAVVPAAGCAGLDTKSSSSSSKAAAAGRIGSPVSDGKFQFVVTSVDKSKTAGDVTNQFLVETAKGEYVNVHLTVTNTGDEAQSYFSNNQKLIVAGKQFDAASVLGVSGDGDNINPGLGLDTVVSFDVPPGSTPDAIELHDSAFSGGVQVKL
jgi:hypothetical protein